MYYDLLEYWSVTMNLIYAEEEGRLKCVRNAYNM